MNMDKCYIIQMGYLLFVWYIKKCIFFYVIVVTFFQYLPYFQNKNTNRKNLQYENNLRFFSFLSKTKVWVFKIYIFPKGYLEKGGSSRNQDPLIFGSIWYS